MTLSVIILTYNEEKHLTRCLDSLKSLNARIYVVDCFSSDRTVSIAHDSGATVLQHAWTNHAEQFNWALDQLPSDAGWVFRLDADEYLTGSLCDEIGSCLESVPQTIAGFFCTRRIVFQGRKLSYGGLNNLKVLRLFRYGRGFAENRWMDEHIKVSGDTRQLKGELIDENLNPLTWWIDKHNRYASREAADALNLKYGFMPRDSVASLRDGGRVSRKRWVKEYVYPKLPAGIRAFLYFSYRMIILLGFLDGRAGITFHILQGFWYRYLVDAKIHEVRRYVSMNHCDVVCAIRNVLGINVGPSAESEN